MSVVLYVIKCLIYIIHFSYDFVGLNNVDFENYFANVNEFINIVNSASASRFLSDKALLNEGCQGDINTGFFL